MSHKSYTVSDGDLVLTLEALSKEDGGGYGVTSPLEPQLVTEAKTFEERCSTKRRARSEEHTSELQSLAYLVCRLLLEKKKRTTTICCAPPSDTHLRSLLRWIVLD